MYSVPIVQPKGLGNVDMKNSYFSFEQRMDISSGQNNTQLDYKDKATIIKQIRTVIVAEKMEEKALDVELRRVSLGRENPTQNCIQSNQTPLGC